MSESHKQNSIAERELEILRFWKENRIFEQTLLKPAPKGEFVFYDGPPFATGLPHYGHILAGTIKDVIPRWRTMQGYRVPRRWGWDCHGLPVEHEVEKELGLRAKKDIERYGVAEFNARARETVMRYAGDWRRIVPRLGRWVDMENDYRTMDADYTESVWWVFKTLYERGLIYEGFKSMHLCPRCETTLSNFEVTQGYKTIDDLSVYVKFPILNSQFPNTYLIAWTTTPWTLPGNAALAVHPERDYALVEITASNAPEIPAGDTYIVGAREEILRRVFSAGGEPASGGGGESFHFNPSERVGTFRFKGAEVAFSARKGIKGRELIGQPYRPLFDYYSRPERFNLPPDSRLDLERGWKVCGAEFVTEEDGTGIVHIAPAFGEDDYQLAVKEKLPFIRHVRSDGTFAPEVADFAGLPAKPKDNPRETDERIAAALAAAKKLLRSESYAHEYPHCWRCETPLLNYAAPSWFVRVGALREKLVEANRGIRWIPEDVGRYRFGNWLAEAKDWAISRSRYWGAPIPLWRCERCKSVKAVGSLDELRRGSGGRFTAVVLLRHGESESNTRGVLDDLPEGFPLTRRGRRAARESARRIAASGGADAIFSSPVERTRMTAEIVGRVLGKPVTVDEGLREVDSGEWDEKREDEPTVADAKAAYGALPPPERYRAKRGGSGESWEEVERRMAEALRRILAKHRGERVAIVSHKGPLGYLLKTLYGFSLEEAEENFGREQFNRFAEPLAVYFDHATGRAAELHRPLIDDVLLSCDACAKSTGAGGDLMRRVPEVFDCWFESGAMPYGQAHYPFERDGRFEPRGGWFKKPRGFPADFIAEGLDQTRGWFYSLLVLGAALFGKAPYRSVIANGIILAEDGAKMSKRLKNYPDPLEVVARHGADALRYYLLASPVVRGEELRFSERGVDEVAKKVFNRLDNVLQFFLLYSSSLRANRYTLKADHVLDRWIHARLTQLISAVTAALENYELDKAIRPIGDFVDDLSTWYLRRSRERIKSAVLEEKEAALGTLGFALLELSKVMAPFAPFFAEHLYKEVGGEKKSVHLEEWSEARKADRDILGQMVKVRYIVSLALEGRAKAGVKVRQPLRQLKVKSGKLEVSHELAALVKEEVNVKEVIFDSALQAEVELDTAITPELKDEGQYRELVRFVQEMRKRDGFRPGEFAQLTVSASGVSRRFVEQRAQELSRAAALKDVVILDTVGGGESFEIGEIALTLRLSKA